MRIEDLQKHQNISQLII